MIVKSNFRVRYFLTGTCLNLTLSIKLMIDSWCSNSKIVNLISDHGFKCLLGSTISTDKTEYVAKFRFASVYNHIEMFILFSTISTLFFEI